MSLADLSGPVSRALLAVGTATYECRDFEALDKVPEALQGLVGTLTGLGYSAMADGPGYSLDLAPQDLCDAASRAAVAASVVVVYYTGHGAHPLRDTYRLVSSRSQPADLARTALAARDLPVLLTRRDGRGDPVAEQPMVLIVLDCCYSGSAGMEMLGEALRGIGNPDTWVIASAGALEYARQGLFAKAFCDALLRPATGPSQRFVSLDSIVQAVNDAFAGQAWQHVRLFPPAAGSTGIPPFFPNPRHEPGLAGLTVADQQHWLSRARGGPQESTTGFYLTGRTGRVRAAEDLAAWMTDPDPGRLAVVTGSPGSGKSALLALPTLLAEPARRAELLRAAEPDSLIARTARLLPGGTPVTAVRARGLNADQVAGVIGRALGRDGGTAFALLEDLDASPETGRRVVIVDAVDEAASPATLISGLLVPLARQPGLKIAVGCRRHVLPGFGDADLTIDLDTRDYQDPQGLVDYVHRLLLAAEEPGVITAYTPGAASRDGREEAAAAVAAAIAQRATAREGGAESFLIGRLLALAARDRARPADIQHAGWQSELPASVAEAFDEDLARLGNHAPLALALLRALAWARGPGLPWENIWIPVAMALGRQDGAQGQPVITDKDVRWLLGKAGAYVVEDLGPGGRSVYRPFHDLLAAHLRGEPSTGRAAPEPAAADARREQRARTEQTITAAMLDTVAAGRQGQRDWLTAHPYVRTYLSQHAADAGQLASLLDDADFLATADPVTLSPLLFSAAPQRRDAVRIYRRARPMLGDDPQANAAYLREATRALTGAVPDVTGIRPLYHTRLASVRRDDSLFTLTGHTERVTSVEFGASPDGHLLLVSSSSRDKTARVWDPVTGTPVGEPVTDQTDWADPRQLSTSHHRDLQASRDEDGTVRVRDSDTGELVGEPLTGHTGSAHPMAFGTSPDGHLLLASGDTGNAIQVWDVTVGTPVTDPLTGHTNDVLSVAFGTADDGRLLLASGSRDKTVRIWDPVTAAPAGEPFTGHTGLMNSVAFGTADDGRLLLASASGDGAVRVWDRVTGALAGEPLTGHTGSVDSVAFGTGPGGRLLLASGGIDKTVRVWDPVTGSLMGEPLTGHTSWVSSVAFGTGPGGRLLLASGSGDNTVRIWDPLTGTPAGEPLTGHLMSVSSVAFGTYPGGRLLLASASADGTARVWDPVTGTPVGEPLAGHTGYVRSVAFGTGPGGRLLLASGGIDKTVRIWDPVTGVPVGQPLTGHTHYVLSVTFGADLGGRLLVSGAADKTVRVWDPMTGACLTTLRRRYDAHSIAAAGLALAIADEDGVCVLELDTSSAQ